ncbi:MAG: hypothetical protein RIS79_667 [Verrucomicrobiota bacterium]|jgi:hypothetical protein
MDPVAVRELARIQSVLHVLKTQRDTLSELSDIQAFRGLEESYRDDLEEAQKRGLVASDPVAEVRSDWLRLVSWSNRIQLALRAADNLGNNLDTLGPKPDKDSGKKKMTTEEGWRPSLSDLQQLKVALEDAPKVLADAIEQGCRELQPGDWSSGRPYCELAEVADAMEWTEKLVLAESPGAWAHGICPRERPLVASRLAVERSSSLIERRLRSLKDRLAYVVGLIQSHGQSAGTLEEVGRLTSSGQVESARQMMATVQAVFGDLDYSAKEQDLASCEKRLRTVRQEIAKLEELVLEKLDSARKTAIEVKRAPLLTRWISKRLMTKATLAVGESLVELSAAVAKTANDRYSKLVGEQMGFIYQLQGVLLKESDPESYFKQLSPILAKATAEAELRWKNPLVSYEKWFFLRYGLVSLIEAGVQVRVDDIPVRWIPPGQFIMGSPLGEAGQLSDEVQHQVVLTQGFFMSETECTQAQWEVIMGSNPSNFKGPNQPVETVNWVDAVQYCRKLTAKQRTEGIIPEGWEWRLPTEAEWEYAARAGTTGSRHGELDAIAWWSGNSAGKPHPVKQRGANGWGLNDMMGNVYEWCSDWYGDYPTRSVTDPTGASSGSCRVFRGGSWTDVAGFVRSASRHARGPGMCFNNLGFRPALSSVR